MSAPSYHTMPFELGSKRELRVVALVGGALVGTVSVANYGSVAPTLYQLYVAPEWRGEGVGSALVARACTAAQGAGASAVGAIVEHGGPAAFWAAQGFTPAHVDGDKLLVTLALGGGGVAGSGAITKG